MATRRPVESQDMRPAPRLTRSTLTAQLEDALRVDIIEGVLVPGQRLRAADLSKRYGVSATPFREALQRLAAQRLVDLDPRFGATVADISRAELRDIYQMRDLLEGLAWRSILFLYGGLAVLVCVLWWVFARSHWQSEGGSRPEHFGRLLKDRFVWVLLFFLIASMGCYDTLATWMPKVLEMKQLNKAFASVLPLGFFLAGPVVGLISDRFRNRMRTVFILGLLAAAAITGIHYAPFPLLLLCIFLAGFATIGVLAITLALPAEQAGLKDSIGTVVGLISSLGNIGPLVMPVIFGFLIDWTKGSQASILAVAALAGVTFILGGRFGPKYPPPERV